MIIVTLRDVNGYQAVQHQINNTNEYPHTMIWRDRVFINNGFNEYIEVGTIKLPHTPEFRTTSGNTKRMLGIGSSYCPICEGELVDIHVGKSGTHYLCPSCDREQLEEYEKKIDTMF